MNILLVEPNFPIPPKSKNYKYYFPISLLKLAAYHRHLGHKIRLVRGNRRIRSFTPDKVLITSLFTYWSEHVHSTVRFYKKVFPNSRVIVGGIYASLMPDHCKSSGCDDVFVGMHSESENFLPAYDLVPHLDFQVLHSMRGCVRRCSFCGVWQLEPETYKTSIKEEIIKRKVIFYDNNFLANPYIEGVLEELVELKREGKTLTYEAQSGFDYKLLTPKLAKLLKEANFINPRIAWDHHYRGHRSIKNAVDILRKTGFAKTNIHVFMLYNHDIEFKELKRKLQKCYEWKVQVADCRFRPLSQTYDNYNPQAFRTGQTGEDYYIHSKWTDNQVRAFRRAVRQQNICIRHNIDPERYNNKLERLTKKKKEEIIAEYLPSLMNKCSLSRRDINKINKIYLRTIKSSDNSK